MSERVTYTPDDVGDLRIRLDGNHAGWLLHPRGKESWNSWEAILSRGAPEGGSLAQTKIFPPSDAGLAAAKNWVEEILLPCNPSTAKS